MKFSYRRVKKAIQKLRDGREISSEELAIINRRHRKQFYAGKAARIAMATISRMSQMAVIASQPIPRDAEPISQRMIKALETLEVVIDAHDEIVRISSEIFEPKPKRLYVELYSKSRNTVGNYGTCSNIAAPLPSYPCGSMPISRPVPKMYFESNADEKNNWVLERFRNSKDIVIPKADWTVEGSFRLPVGWKDNPKGLTPADFKNPQP